jgi:hypothetical protein
VGGQRRRRILARLADGGAPIACSLPDDTAVVGRLGEWAAALAGAVSRESLAGGGVRIALGPTVDLGALAALVEADHRCCPFFAFAITVDGRGVALEIRAPAGADETVAALIGATPPPG